MTNATALQERSLEQLLTELEAVEAKLAQTAAEPRGRALLLAERMTLRVELTRRTWALPQEVPSLARQHQAHRARRIEGDVVTEQLPRGTAERVDVAYIAEQRAAGWPDIHPEDYCHRCGNSNPSWWTESAIWNEVMETATSPWHGIICPSCFASLWAELWPDTAWELRLSKNTRGARAFFAQKPTAQLVTYVGFGGHTENVVADFELGAGRFRPTHQYGLRRAIWDAAFGYVSGFRKRDIAYFIVTRSLSASLRRASIRFETRHVDRATCPHIRYARVGRPLMCFDCGTTDQSALALPTEQDTAS